jgi:hypothetical protein
VVFLLGELATVKLLKIKKASLRMIKLFKLLTLGVVFFNPLGSQAQSSFQIALEKAARMPGNEMVELQKESAKTKSLVRECIEYCRPIKVDGYRVENLLDCKNSANLIHSRDDYYCLGDAVAHVKIYTIVRNRFGEEKSEVSSCGWKTHDYIIEAVCSKSSNRALDLKRRKDNETQFLIPPGFSVPNQ